MLWLGVVVGFSSVLITVITLVKREAPPPTLLTCPHCGKETLAFARDRKLDPVQNCTQCHRRFEPGQKSDGEQWSLPPAPGPQLAGMACIVCGEKIHSHWEAMPCPSCAAPVHHECLPHRHGDEGQGDGGPYRG